MSDAIDCRAQFPTGPEADGAISSGGACVLGVPSACPTPWAS